MVRLVCGDGGTAKKKARQTNHRSLGKGEDDAKRATVARLGIESLVAQETPATGNTLVPPITYTCIIFVSVVCGGQSVIT